MGRGFCPRCGAYSLGFNPESKRFQCYNSKCIFTVAKHTYEKILPNTHQFELAASSNIDKITAYFGEKPKKSENSRNIEKIVV